MNVKTAIHAWSLTFCLASLSCPSSFAQNTVADWLPIHVGDKWTYEHVSLDGTAGGIAHPEITRWKTEETILSSTTIAEGTLVSRRIQIVGPAPAWVPKQEAWLIRDSCAYGLREGQWNPLDQQLTPSYRETLSSGEISADFCFPLRVGKVWGAPHWGERPTAEAKDWKVTGIQVSDASAPERQNSVHVTSISSYPGSGMTVDVWLAKGVGIVREKDLHHGTYEEERTRLIRFEPVSQR